ncbi:RING-H2 finger protein ATL63-like [Cucurbita pepo subsp. pepo]|uniref:RING-H2 finger protein ATL63-like n=1 Tax=Cucurbita pepo subsp. pepo TaxID=3664 RepID=UPI000C9D5E43|nr:RING-H2 finger protein ATL63-like [Cucurbita pepo subsp. pepo]XP_023521603.1 RING-H2 finger protein ATL63-like [Cucurbita pepo subsp. pepo]XP_023523166.1 RING-H2 finger protein ATL63-like [Cucurbita pepo subsp. pepo]
MAFNSTSLSDFTQSIFSYNSNVILAALISLLLVVLFVLLLHAYANCFFPRPRHRHAQRSSVTVSYVLGPPRLSRFESIPFDLGFAQSKGLDSSVISAIPLFVYESEEKKCATVMECVICLSEFEEREIGRRLPICNHGFHLECIDMWLNSHANCPVCRAPVVAEAVESGGLSGESEIGEEIVTEERTNCEIQRNEEQNGQFHSSSSSSSSSTDPPLMSLGASLKRMLSRNRSNGRIFPSSNGDELNV